MQLSDAAQAHRLLVAIGPAAIVPAANVPAAIVPAKPVLLSNLWHDSNHKSVIK